MYHTKLLLMCTWKHMNVCPRWIRFICSFNYVINKCNFSLYFSVYIDMFTYGCVRVSWLAPWKSSIRVKPVWTAKAVKPTLFWSKGTPWISFVYRATQRGNGWDGRRMDPVCSHIYPSSVTLSSNIFALSLGFSSFTCPLFLPWYPLSPTWKKTR